MLTNNLNECCCILTYSQGTHWEFCEEFLQLFTICVQFFFFSFVCTVCEYTHSWSE